MIKHFLKLEWKQYFRSSYWEKGIALKIIMGFFVLYFLAAFLSIGIGGYFILKKMYPEQDPLQDCKFIFIICHFRRFNFSLYNAEITSNEYKTITVFTN